MIFLRYLVVQVIAYVVDMGAFMLILNIFTAEPLVANLISKTAAGSFAFIFQRSFTFRVIHKELIGRQALRYFFVLMINIPLTSVILALTLLWITTPTIAKFLSDIACVGISFVLGKYFIFSGNPNNEISILKK